MRLIRSKYQQPQNQTIQEDILQHRAETYSIAKAKASLINLLVNLEQSSINISAYVSIREDFLCLYLSPDDVPTSDMTYTISFSSPESFFAVSYRMPRHLAPWSNAYVVRSFGFPTSETEASAMILQAIDYSEAWKIE
jgi:hypothetical protein